MNYSIHAEMNEGSEEFYQDLQLQPLPISSVSLCRFSGGSLVPALQIKVYVRSLADRWLSLLSTVNLLMWGFQKRENNSIIVLHTFAPTNMQVVLFVNRQVLIMSAGALNIGSTVGPNL